MFCHKCGNQVAEGAGFCHKCGTKVIAVNTEQPTPDVPQLAPVSAVPQQTLSDKGSESIHIEPEPTTDKGKLFKLAKYCRALSALRFLDAGIWLVIIIVQIGAAEFSTIIWNLVGAGMVVYLGVRLLPGKYIEQYNRFGKYDMDDIVKDIGFNIALAVVGFILYGMQLFAYEMNIMYLLIALEIVVVVVSILALSKVDKSSRTLSKMFSSK